MTKKKPATEVANKTEAPKGASGQSEASSSAKDSGAAPENASDSAVEASSTGAPPSKEAAAKNTKAADSGASANYDVSPNKPLPRKFLIDMAAHVKHAVEPLIRQAKGREIVGSATSGDATFKIDKVAEKALLQFLKDARLPVAYYSEDAGYTTFTTKQPHHLLVIDPIDGTRAAKSGFESCVVSVASTRVLERPRIVDIENGCVLELAGHRAFYAERGKGTRIYVNNRPSKPKPSAHTDRELMAWSMTVAGRPAELIFPTAAKFIDLTSLKGGFFACNSTSFSLTRLLTGQLDACVDFANRYLRDIPEIVKDQFINAGRGSMMGIAPYDIAASLLIAQEAGCVVTDAYGDGFDDVLLLDTSVSNQQSMIAASNPQLHEMLMRYFDTRIRQFEQVLKRRAPAAPPEPDAEEDPLS